MGRNNATFLEGSKEQLKVWLLEQALRWPLRVGRVGYDDIKGVFEILQVLEAIPDMNFHFGVLEANGHPREVFLGETNDSLHRI